MESGVYEQGIWSKEAWNLEYRSRRFGVMKIGFNTYNKIDIIKTLFHCESL